MKDYKCWLCGDRATRTRVKRWTQFNGAQEVAPNSKLRCYCQKCYDKTIEEEKADHQMYVKLKKKEMFVKACDLLESQDINMNDYREAIETIEEYLAENPDKFDSSYEVIAAIVLIQNRIRIKMQYKIGRYQVDFLLPELMVVLEIDGDRHQYKKDYDSKRDTFIKRELGPDWEIVRIDTKYLDQNASRLVKAIKAVLDKRMF